MIFNHPNFLKPLSEDKKKPVENKVDIFRFKRSQMCQSGKTNKHLILNGL